MSLHYLCHESDLKAVDSRGFELETMSVVLVRRDDLIRAYENSCPHRGIRLEWQPDQFLDYEKQFIQCATHGAMFTLDAGECIAGPCPGEKLRELKLVNDAGKLSVELPAD